MVSIEQIEQKKDEYLENLSKYINNPDSRTKENIRSQITLLDQIIDTCNTQMDNLKKNIKLEQFILKSTNKQQKDAIYLDYMFRLKELENLEKLGKETSLSPREIQRKDELHREIPNLEKKLKNNQIKTIELFQKMVKIKKQKERLERLKQVVLSIKQDKNYSTFLFNDSSYIDTQQDSQLENKTENLIPTDPDEAFKLIVSTIPTHYNTPTTTNYSTNFSQIKTSESLPVESSIPSKQEQQNSQQSVNPPTKQTEKKDKPQKSIDEIIEESVNYFFNTIVNSYHDKNRETIEKAEEALSGYERIMPIAFKIKRKVPKDLNDIKIEHAISMQKNGGKKI